MFVVYVSAIALTFVNVFPTYYMAISAFKTTSDFYARYPLLIPFIQFHPTLIDFQELIGLENPSWLHALFNSGAEASLTATVAVAVALLGAYSLARHRTRFARYVRGYFFLSQMVGGFFVLVPLFVVVNGAKLFDTYFGVMVPFLAFNLPFAIMLLTSFFVNLNPSLEEAAQIDGCSRLSAFRRIALPLAYPAALAAWLFVFLAVWGDWAVTNTFTQIAARTAVPVIYNLYINPFGSFFVPALMAAMLIMTVPPTAVFIVFRTRFIQGLTGGAVKG